MTKSLLLLIFLLGTFSSLLGIDSLFFDPKYQYTQEDVDSIIHSDLILDTNYEIFGQILESNDLKGWEWYYLKEGRSKYLKRDLQEAKASLEKALSILGKKNETIGALDYKCRINTNVVLGQILGELSFHKEAILAFQQAKDDTKYYPYKWMTSITAGIAGNHYLLGNDSIALELSLELSQDTVYMKNPGTGIWIWNTIAVLNQEKGDFDEAKIHFKKGLKLSKESGFNAYDKSLYTNLSSISWEQDSMNLAKIYLQKALNVEGYKRPLQDVFYKKSLGTLKILEGDIYEGIKLIKEVVDTVTVQGIANKNHKEIVGGSYSVLSYAYSQLNDHDEALNMLEKNIELEQWFGEFQIKEQLQQLEIEYQAKEKDQSISSLTTTNVQQSAIISKQRLQVLSSVLFAGLLGFIGFFFYRQRSLKAKYKEANLEQRLLRTQMDPHFVYNSLNSVSSLVYQKSEMAIPYISKLASLLRLILENSRKELVPLEDEIAALDSYLSLESNFGSSFKYIIDTTGIHIEDFLAPPMLIQPFVENAIKHGFLGIENPEIKLSITHNSKANVLEVSIVDNGVGLSQSKRNKKHQSVSTSIVRERLSIFGDQYKVDADLVIEELPNKAGTKVLMTIPYLNNK